MRVDTCTGGWPMTFGYKTPLFSKSYTGTPDATADDDYGSAGYQNATAKATFLEVALTPMMRNIYAYNIAYTMTAPTNGDYVEIGEYDAAGAAIWVRRFNYTGGAWDYSYSKVICEGLTVTLYNSYGDKTTLPRTKPYGRLFMRASTSGTTEVYLQCSYIYTEVTKEMIVNNSWDESPNPVDSYISTQTSWGDGYQPYYIRYNRVESLSIEISKPKSVISVNGTPLSVVQLYTPMKVICDLVLSEIEIAQWRKHMELPQWGNGENIYVTNADIVPNNDYTVDSIDFGDEIEYGTGLYKARLNISVMASTNQATPFQNVSVNAGYPVRSALYRHSQVVSRSTIRNTMQEPIDACTVKMYHLTIPQCNDLQFDVRQMLCSQILYAPPAGTAPFGPHRGDGPFLAKIAGLRATVSNVNRVDAELDLIYYGEA